MRLKSCVVVIKPLSEFDVLPQRILFASSVAREVEVFKKETPACCGRLGDQSCSMSSSFGWPIGCVVLNFPVLACDDFRTPMHNSNHIGMLRAQRDFDDGGNRVLDV